MKKLWILPLLAFIIGCQASPLEWAWRHEVSYTVMHLAPKDYEAIRGSRGVHPDSKAFFVPPATIVILQGYEDLAMEHELNHLRELHEGLPWHTLAH